MLSKAKKGSHNRTRDNMGFEMKRLRFKCPQRTGRLGRGLEMGRRPSGGTPLNWVRAHSIELALPLPLLHQSGCGFLGLGGALASSYCP
ncbi:unnamed protein product [Microthlaspi erraticum]|uniref:Uncharacterized protein n=1 Tax=Microthlaspi erraticum TaxID=1685480 RepID=A0A6D2HLK6_9BRAS|nr:unnamed protein product [Microthlaspi erraticum]